MAEHHRIRKKRVDLKLLEDEFTILENKAKESKISKAEYLRMLIAYGGVKGSGVTNYTSEDAKKLRYELTSIGNNVNQIAYRVNSNSTASQEDIDALREEFVKLIGVFHNHVMG